jgi:ubiquitin C-terminal hydrolase
MFLTVPMRKDRHTMSLAECLALFAKEELIDGDNTWFVALLLLAV